MKIICPKEIIRLFRKSAKASYPKEDYGILLGTRNSRFLTIKAIYLPEDRQQFADKTCMWKDISTNAQWRREAEEIAKENKFEVLGDIHSHPNFSDCSPSELDWNVSATDWLLGIMGVYCKNGTLYSRYKFWIVPEKHQQIVK